MKIKRGYKILMYIVLAMVLLPLVRVYPKTVIVGYFAGECIGLCHPTYQITRDSIRIDADSNVDSIKSIHQTIRGNFDSLRFSVPLVLGLDITSFGCPDCTDGGGDYLGYKITGITLGHTLDTGHDPWYFPNMGELIRDRIEKIKTIRADYNKK